jgi:phosphoribosylaminoimidazole-succinocarboxamide synthase
MGSVKDLKIIEQPVGGRSGWGLFTFSDRYSVFDWGEMPDQITNKGKALCTIGAYFFERLLNLGIDCHYRGLLYGQGVVRRLKSIINAPSNMAVNLYRVIRPKEREGWYDYSAYRETTENFLIPLEVIYRNRLPEGSSVFKRLAEGTVSLDGLGLKKIPSPGDILDRPMLDVSTKLEATDRYLDWSEARAISGLSDFKFNRMKKLVEEINSIITHEVGKIGLVNEDGKLEFAVNGEGNVVVVDVLGTPDECRFTYNGIHVSKELARIYYRGSEWHRDVEEAKMKDRTAWKSLVTKKPPRLPERMARLISGMYQAVANELTGTRWFPVESLAEIMRDIQSELERQKEKSDAS